MSILLRIAYDGTEFSGWARQKPRPDGSAIRTVQGEVERALSDLFRQPVTVRGASRTDAGVHAHGQLAAFEPPSSIPPSGVARALTGRLPADVTVVAAWSEERWADVRGGNDGKCYRYRIRTTGERDPVGGRDEWHFARRLDVAAMRDACGALVGEHDFSAFRSAHCQARSTTRTVHVVRVLSRAAPFGPVADAGRLPSKHPVIGDVTADLVTVEVQGQAFLQNMVRIIAGTLVEIGRGQRPVDCIPALLAQGDRRNAGVTAPACGLTLVEVKWPSSPEDGGAS